MKISEKKLLAELRVYYREYKLLPSYFTIAELMGFKSKNAAYGLVNKLIENGHLDKDSSGRLLPTSNFLGIPVFESVRAGFSTPVEESRGDRIQIDEYLIPHPMRTIMITVKGGSMIDAGIYEGDIVIVEKGQDASLGDIIVAEIDGGYTLKFLDKKDSKFFLRSGNVKYPNIYPEEELKIFGLVVGVVRKTKYT